VSELSFDVDLSERNQQSAYGLVKKLLKIGQKIQVLCIGVDVAQGSIKLSQKRLDIMNMKKMKLQS
jgi:ribosomal protein S1